MDRLKTFLALGLLGIASPGWATVEEFVQLCEFRDLPQSTAVTLRSLERWVVGFSGKKLSCQELGDELSKRVEIDLPGNTFDYYEVVDLEPIALFPQIKALRIPFQKINALDALIPLEIEVLDIEGVHVSLRPLARMHKIRELKLSVKASSEVDVLGFLSALHTLEIRAEDSESVTLRSLPPYVRNLTLTGRGFKNLKAIEGPFLQKVALNFVRSRDLEWLKPSAPSLNTLVITGGQFKDLRAVGDLENLSLLVVSQVGLENGDFLGRLRKLESLDLSYNKLTTIEPLRTLTQMRSLSLAGNQIYDASALESLFKMEELDLQNNQLFRFSLGYLERLRKLNLAQNRLTMLPQASIGDAVYRLRELHLARNEIRNIPPEVARLSQLQQLSLESNNLRDVRELASLGNLEILNLQDNKISDVSALSALQKLQSLYLGDNVLPRPFVCPVLPASVCFP